MTDGRFLRFYVLAGNLKPTADDFIRHFGNNTDDISRTFRNWQENFVIILSTDKAEQHLNLLTNGTYTKINEPQYGHSVDGTYPIILMDPKYKIRELNGKRLTAFTARFGLLKSNERIKGQETLSLVKLGLDRPVQANLTDMSNRVDPAKLEQLVNNEWASDLKANVVLPQFRTTGKTAPAEKQEPHVDVTPTAPTAEVIAPTSGDTTLNTLITVVNDIDRRIRMLDLNSNRNTLMAADNSANDQLVVADQNQTSSDNDSSKISLSKTMFAAPRVDLENDGSIADALDSLAGMARMFDAKSTKTLIMNFLTVNNMTSIIHDLKDEELADIKKFQEAMMLRFGSADPVAEFNMIKERHLEDPSVLLNRIERAWRRVKKMDAEDPIPEGEKSIIRDRYIKSLKNPDLRKDLRKWSTPYDQLIIVTRDHKSAGKLDDEETPSPSGATMLAFGGCQKCGLAHDTATCRSNPKQKTMFNKRKISNKPVSRRQPRIIPDNLGNDNRYQPTQKSTPLIKNGYRGRQPERQPKRVRFSTNYRPNDRTQSNWRTNTQNRSRSRSPNFARSRSRSNTNSNWRTKRYQTSKPWTKFSNRKTTAAYLAMADYDENDIPFEYPFDRPTVESQKTSRRR